MAIYRQGKRDGVNELLDLLTQRFELKNDAVLARHLDVKPPIISKLRHGRMPLGPTILVRIHEVTGMSIRQIKAVAEQDPTGES